MTEIALLENLRSFGDLKVWSFLVTLLGDLTPDKGAELSGPLVSRLSTRLGIKPEALRVALHRLRKDGWIESRREGREARYCLTPKARTDTKAVYDIVYSNTIAQPDNVFLLTFEHTPPKHAGLPIAPRCVLSAHPAPDALVTSFDTSSIPPWVRDHLTSVEQIESYTNLRSLLAGFAPSRSFTSEDKLVLRLIILHRWRRIVLRHDPLAAALMGTQWIGADCRSTVAGVLASLPRSLIDDL
ncbi:MAG: PaaX family transcriptional regulator C-terminal domain-containing protein [Paracoccaceae bacterium]